MQKAGAGEGTAWEHASCVSRRSGVSCPPSYVCGTFINHTSEYFVQVDGYRTAVVHVHEHVPDHEEKTAIDSNLVEFNTIATAAPFAVPSRQKQQQVGVETKPVDYPTCFKGDLSKANRRQANFRLHPGGHFVLDLFWCPLLVPGSEEVRRRHFARLLG